MIFHVDLCSRAALRKLCVNFGISFDAFDHFNNFSIPALECELGYEIVQPEVAEENNSESLEIIALLERLDSILSEFQPTAESAVSRDDATSIANGTCACSLDTWTCGLDFTLELRRAQPLISPNSFANIYAHLIRIAGGDHGLIRENHNFGYHFHYAQIKSKRRANILLTFDKDSKESVQPLYCEYHSGDFTTDPTKFGTKRRRAIYDAAKPSITNPGIEYFRKPSDDAQVLYPPS